MRVSILTISDSVAGGKVEDRSGALVADRCLALGWTVVARSVLPDDRGAIERYLKQVCDSSVADVILTTGGTGLGPRDVTPEATMAVSDRLIPGLPELMRNEGHRKTPRAILSRSAAGICGSTMIINLPGSPRGAVESLDVVADLLPHALDVLHGARHD
jgi:molybdopterin adenylyltransferase